MQSSISLPDNLLPILSRCEDDNGTRSFLIDGEYVVNTKIDAIELAMRIVAGNPVFIAEHTRPWLLSYMLMLRDIFLEMELFGEIEGSISRRMLELGWLEGTRLLVAFEVMCDFLYGHSILGGDYFNFADSDEDRRYRRYSLDISITNKIKSYRHLDHFCNDRSFKTFMTQRLYGQQFAHCQVPDGDRLILSLGDKEATYDPGDQFTIQILRGYKTEGFWGDDYQTCLYPEHRTGFLRTSSLNPIFYADIVNRRDATAKTPMEALSIKFKLKARVPLHWIVSDDVGDTNMYGPDMEALMRNYRGIMGW